jgi:hypothetical protein
MALTNNCNGDVIDFTGTGHVIETTGPSNSAEGQFRVVFAALEGTGLTGETYILSGQSVLMGTSTVVQYMTVLEEISQGPDQNSNIRFTLQIVFDSQGNVIEIHGTATDTCTG